MRNIAKYFFVSLFLLYSTGQAALKYFCDNLPTWQSSVVYNPATTSPNYIVTAGKAAMVVYNDTLWWTWWAAAGSQPSQSNSAWHDSLPCSYLNLDTTAPVLSSSSNANSSSSSSSYTPVITKDNWSNAKISTVRCDLDGQADSTGLRTCIDPAILQGADLVLPSNVTRISRNMITLCNLQGQNPPPLAIVYVWDNSGSMSTSDAKHVIPAALDSAMTLQNTLDPNGQVGFIKFSDVIIDTIRPVALGAGHNLQSLISWADYVAGGGTNYYKPLAMARSWLASPRFNGYRKVIFIVTDGMPSDSAATINMLDSAQQGQSPAFPEIHAIFLNQDASSRAQGQNFLTLLVNKTKTPDGSAPTVWPISTAADMANVFTTLIGNLIQTRKPISMEMDNLSTGKSIKANASQLVMQKDSSWNIPLDTTLSLAPGLNSIRFVTNYTSATGDSSTTAVNFNIRIDSSIFNQSFDIPGLPLQTTCYEPNSIKILDQGGKLQSILQTKDSMLTVQFHTIEPYGFGDSVIVWLKTRNEDSLSLVLNLVSKDANGATYSLPISTKWIMDSLSHGLLPLQAWDSIIGQWKHPTDARDGAYGLLPVALPVPLPLSVWALDQDANGRIDHLCLRFGVPLEDWMIQSMRLNWRWPVQKIYQGINLIQKSKYAISDHVFCTTLDTTLDRGTAVADSSKQIRAFTGLLANGQSSDSVVLAVIDSMPPLLDTVRIVYKTKDRSSADLVLQFSEPIASDSVTLDPAFDFWVKKQLNENYIYPTGNWYGGGTNYRIPMSFAKDTGFQVFPYDSVRMKVLQGGVMDLSGLQARLDNPLIPVFGEMPFHFSAPDVVNAKSNDDSQGKITFEVVNSDQDGLDKLSNNGNQGFVFGPISVDTTIANVQNIFPWKVDIYDISGQYVERMQGSIDCTSPEWMSQCQQAGGAKVLFQWNGRADGGRKAGVGIYLWHIQIENSDKWLKMGLSREH